MAESQSTRQPWAVVGTGRDPRRIAELLSCGSSVLIAGPLGSGRSHLLRIVVSELLARELKPMMVRPSRSLRNVPFGALDASPDPRSVLAREGFEASDGPLLVVVDDADQLDRESAEALIHAVHRGSVTALLALEIPRVHNADVAESDLPSAALGDLWLHGFADRIDLSELTRDDAEQLVDAFSNTAEFDIVTRAVVIDRADGSRILLRELASRAASALTGGRDPISAVHDLHRHGRLRDTLAAHVTRLSEDDRHALAVLGHLPGIDYADALRIVPEAVIASTISAGLVHTDGTVRRRLFANAALAAESENQLAPWILDASLDRAATRMMESAGGWWSSPVAVMIAQRWHGHHLAVPALESASAEFRARVALDAARYANDTGHPTLALAFAKLGDTEVDSSALELERAHAAASVACSRDALIDLERLARDDQTVGRYLRLRGHLDAAYQPEVIDEILTSAVARGQQNRPEIDLALAGRAALQMKWHDAAAGASRAEAYGADGSTRVRATLIAAFSAVHLGRWGETTAQLDKARRLMSAPGVHASVASTERILALCVEILASQMAGVETVGTRDRLRQETLTASRERSLPGMTLAALASALLRARASDVDGALAELEAAGRIGANLALGPYLSLAELAVARYFALLGRTDAARALLGRTDDAAGELPPLLQHDRELTESCIHAADGRLEDALATAEAAYELSDSVDSPAMFLRDAYQLAVLGASDEVLLQRMRRVADATDIEAAHMLVERVKNILLKSGPLTRRTPVELLRVSAPWSGGTEQDDRTSPEAGSRLAIIRPTNRVTGEWLRMTTAAESALTRRERQIGVLVAEGMTNREIAERLFLSVRTVESHVYQARVKVGARSRAELGRLVRSDATDFGDGTVGLR